MKKLLVLLALTIFLSSCHNDNLLTIKKFPYFVTGDLQGNEFNSLIFNKKKITVVSILEINSLPCKNLIPKLWRLNREFTEIQAIGLIVDNKNVEKYVLLDSPKDFTYLIVNNSFLELLVEITQLPTTIFVDNYGNIIGQPVIGDNIAFIQKEIINLLEIGSKDFYNLSQIQNEIFY